MSLWPGPLKRILVTRSLKGSDQDVQVPSNGYVDIFSFQHEIMRRRTLSRNAIAIGDDAGVGARNCGEGKKSRRNKNHRCRHVNERRSEIFGIRLALIASLSSR